MRFSDKFVSEDIEYSSFERNIRAPLFRKSFMLNGRADRAELLICGLGFYELFVNGNKITKGYLAPYISNSDHYTYFDRYDIADYLSKGENVIAVMLGDGNQAGKTSSWEFADNVTNSAPLLALSAEIVCGEECISFEADDFVCKKGPVLFNDLRGGIFYDAGLEEAGWTMPGFKETDWHKPIEHYRPRGEAKLCEAEPIRISKELKPVSICKGEVEPYSTQYCEQVKCAEGIPDYKGGYIYDFGENNTGIFRLRIKGKAGQKIDIQTAEQFADDGRLSYKNFCFLPEGFVQRSVYYCKGGEEEVFEPMFTYYGFRYLYVTGIEEEQATEDLLTFLVLSSDLEERGSFECSDKMANTIYEMGRRSDISNFIYFPVDCPHREKNGWTGDASLSAEHHIMTIGAERSWREWLNNIRKAQSDEGRIPGIIPTDKWGYERYPGPPWDAVLFNLPYFAYKYRGETDIIAENAGAMMKYIDYASKQRKADGTIDMCVLGDWLPVEIDGNTAGRVTNITDSTIMVDICRKAEEMFNAIGLKLQAEFARKLGEEVLLAIRNSLLQADKCTVKDATHTTQAMAIYYDIFTNSEKPKAFEHLIKLLKEADYKFTCGCQGLRVLFHVLSRFGRADIAYEMITRAEYPSYGYWALKGETTLPENFKEYDRYFSNSKNHHFLGDVVNWFMSSVGGLKVKSADTVEVGPDFVEKLDWCRTCHKLPEGEIEIYWERKADAVELKIKHSGEVKYLLNISEKYTAEEIKADTYYVCPKG